MGLSSYLVALLLECVHVGLGGFAVVMPFHSLDRSSCLNSSSDEYFFLFSFLVTATLPTRSLSVKTFLEDVGRVNLVELARIVCYDGVGAGYELGRQTLSAAFVYFL